MNPFHSETNSARPARTSFTMDSRSEPVLRFNYTVYITDVKYLLYNNFKSWFVFVNLVYSDLYRKNIKLYCIIIIFLYDYLVSITKQTIKLRPVGGQAESSEQQQESILMETECLKFPGSLCLQCYMRDTALC